VVHELLHLCGPRHDGMYELLLGRYLPDWRERERQLLGWVPYSAMAQGGEDGGEAHGDT
jgi:predicted metal-dependent hydrolase